MPDQLFRQVKAKAALEGLSLKELLTRYIESGLRQLPQPKQEVQRRSALPVIPKRGKAVVPNLTPEIQTQLEEEEDLAKLSRSFGR